MQVLFDNSLTFALPRKRVLVLAGFDPATTYHRLLQPYKTLAKLYGTEFHVIILQIETHDDFNEVANGELWTNAQVVVTQRLGLLQAAVAWKCQDDKKNHIQDFDDAEWLLPDYFRYLKPTYEKGKLVEMFRDMLPRLQNVTSPNKNLLHWLSNDNPNIRGFQLPNALDLSEQQWEKNSFENTPLHVGMVGGAMHHCDAKILSGVFREVGVSNDVEFVMGGNNRSDEWRDIKEYIYKGVPKSRQVVYDYLPLQMYGTIFDSVDIGVVPLLNGKFEESKSALKIAEFGAHGIPTLFSDSADYREWLSPHGLEWLLIPNYKKIADTKHEWTTKLRMLIDDADMRKEFGGKLRKLTEEHFDIRNTAGTLRTILNTVIDGSSVTIL